MKKLIILLTIGAWMTLTASSQDVTGTNRGYYDKDYIKSLIKDVQMGDIYKAEYYRMDSLVNHLKGLIRNNDSSIVELQLKDNDNKLIIANIQAQNENLKKEVGYYSQWVKGIDKELHRAKVKAFIHSAGLVSVIGGLTYLLFKR